MGSGSQLNIHTNELFGIVLCNTHVQNQLKRQQTSTILYCSGEYKEGIHRFAKCTQGFYEL